MGLNLVIVLVWPQKRHFLPPYSPTILSPRKRIEFPFNRHPPINSSSTFSFLDMGHKMAKNQFMELLLLKALFFYQSNNPRQ